MKMKSRVLMVVFVTVTSLFIYPSSIYSQQIQKVQPSLKPQPQQQSQPGQQQKLNLPDLTIIDGLRLERGASLEPLSGSGSHHAEEWFTILFSFTVKNIGTAPAPRFENWLVSEDGAGMMSGGRGIKIL